MTIKEKIVESTRTFASLLTAWVVLMLVMRIGEWLISGFSYRFPGNSLQFLGYAFLADFLFISWLGLILYVLFTLIGLLSLKVARISFLVVAVLVTVAYFSLQKYFYSTTVLLGADIYGYSAKDIQQTVGASGGVNFLTIVTIILLIAAVISFFIMAVRRFKPGIAFSMAIISILCAGLILRSIAGDELKPGLKDDFETSLAENKLDFFIHASTLHFFPSPIEKDIYSDAYSGDYGDAGSSDAIASFQYPQEQQYPFLHTDNTPDVLSPFLKQSDRAPNIVFIVVEGLGRAFSNEGAYLGNFTPFLDSLSQQSLYWENFLSSGGRTFAMLPGLLGSLPFGKNGFTELGEHMPAHLSLPALLRQNGYSSSFYYSGEASFDNMDLFMRKQYAEVFDKASFPAEYQQLPANNGFSWGLEDAELYRYFLAQRANADPSKPFMDLLLTVSTHSPFLLNNAARYDALFEQYLGTSAMSAEQKQAARTYKQQYTTVLYADNALKQFFAAYRQREEFANTIFVLTGDHGLPEIHMSSKIDRYHVPLIVYSPLLQRTAKFKSISSHLDITPSLLAYLKNNYDLRLPAVTSWVGSGLDTARGFRNIHAQALMQTKTEIVDFVTGEYHLNGDRVFRLTPAMQEEVVNDDETRNRLKAGLDRFLQKNQDILNGKKLLPDSVIQTYSR